MAQIDRPQTKWGIVALVCLDCMILFSTSYWRQRAYNVFIATHIFGIALLLPAVRLPLTSEPTDGLTDILI